MSVYNRKGGSGKSGSLREQFNYYKRQLKNRLIREQALQEALGAGTIEGRIHTLFKNINYEQVFKQGITRKVGSKTIRYVGNAAIEIQVRSFRERASKSFQSESFITNYISAMIEAGFSDESCDKVERYLKSISTDRLTILISKGILPSIQFIYSETLSEDEFVEAVKDAVQNGVSNEELREIKQKAKALVKVIKEKSNIIGW